MSTKDNKKKIPHCSVSIEKFQTKDNQKKMPHCPISIKILLTKETILNKNSFDKRQAEKMPHCLFHAYVPTFPFPCSCWNFLIIICKKLALKEMSNSNGWRLATLTGNIDWQRQRAKVTGNRDKQQRRANHVITFFDKKTTTKSSHHFTISIKKYFWQNTTRKKLRPGPVSTFISPCSMLTSPQFPSHAPIQIFRSSHVKNWHSQKWARAMGSGGEQQRAKATGCNGQWQGSENWNH